MQRIYTVARGRIFLLGAFGLMMAGVCAVMVAPPVGYVGGVVAALASIYFIVWARSITIELMQDGLHYRSLSRDRTVLWRGVSEVRFAAVSTSVNLVPAGTSYTLVLRDSSGSLSLSNSLLFQGVSGLPELVQAVLDGTRAPLLEGAQAALRAGRAVEFGAIRVSPSEVRIKTGLRSRTLALNRVQSCRIDKGYVYVFAKGEKSASGPPLSRVPNGIILPQLLSELTARRG